jgi:hypothetical protein
LSGKPKTKRRKRGEIQTPQDMLGVMRAWVGITGGTKA